MNKILQPANTYSLSCACVRNWRLVATGRNVSWSVWISLRWALCAAVDQFSE